MKSIFLVGAVQAFFLAVLLFSKRNKITADYILAAWLIIIGVPLLLYHLNYEDWSAVLLKSERVPTYLMIVNIPLLLIQSPFLYLYVSSIVRNEQTFRSVYLLNFLPVILFFLAYSLVIGFDPDMSTGFNIYEYRYFQVILTFFPLTLVLAFYYIIRSYLRILRYKKSLYKQFSYTEQIDFKWLRVLIIVSSIVWIVMGFFAFQFKEKRTEFDIPDIVLLSISAAIFILGYFGFLRTNVFFNNELKHREKLFEKSGSRKIPDDPEAVTNKQKLLEYMAENKPYLQSKLTIHELADMISIQAYQLSIILNSHLQKNFFDFVNEYRVEEVKKQLKENKRYTILGVAYNCGFNSKSSFNRIFKNHTGITPSEYQKSL